MFIEFISHWMRSNLIWSIGFINRIKLEKSTKIHLIVHDHFFFKYIIFLSIHTVILVYAIQVDVDDEIDKPHTVCLAFGKREKKTERKMIVAMIICEVSTYTFERRSDR